MASSHSCFFSSTGPPSSSSGREDDPNKILANQLNQLTLQQRQDILEDVHGVSAAIKETPELVRETLKQMRDELKTYEQMVEQEQQHYQHRKRFSKLEMATAQSYARALTMAQQTRDPLAPRRRTYSLDDPDFLLSFLRAERFQPIKAAYRLLKFLYNKEQLFGSERLLQVMEMSDLDEDTLDCLHSGYIQVLPGRDAAGRAVMLGANKLRKFKQPVHLVRVIYILAMIVAEDIETQRNGIVCIGYNLGQTKILGRDAWYGLGSLLQGLPLRVASLHFCADNAALRTAVDLAALALGSNHGTRYRFHSGTHLEVIYQLMTFGIPQNILPMSVMGDIDVSHHRAFLQERQYWEEQLSLNAAERRNGETPVPKNGNCTRGGDCQFVHDACTREAHVINIPGPMDVLMGRGRGVQENLGNVRFRYVVETYRNRYDEARKKEKTQLTMEIVRRVNELGGRFLKQDNDSLVGPWIEVSIDVAREKVAHSLRDKRRVVVATPIVSNNMEKRGVSEDNAMEIVESKRVRM